MKTTDQRLKELVEAAEEARITLRELHEAHATLLDIDKKMRNRIATTITEEVTKQVGEISEEARKQMFIAFEEIVDKASKDLKEKLGL